MTDSYLGDNTITSALRGSVVPIGSVAKHPENMRDGNVEAIAQSLARYGQVKPIVVQQSTGYIVAGNHTHEAAESLGWSEIAVVFVDMDDRTALAYLIADNKTSDLGAYHRQRLVDNLQRMADVGWLEQTLWTVDELDDLFAQTEAAITSPEAFGGTFSLSEEQIAEFQRRAAMAGKDVGHRRFREVPLLMNEQDHRQFIDNVSRLETAYGVVGKVATIMKAVQNEADRLSPIEVVSPLRQSEGEGE